MNTNMIITIGRQFGSGGREIGKKLAERMGVPFYDKELLTEAAKQSGISKELFEQSDEKPTNSLLYALAMAAGQLWAADGIVLIFSVVSVYVFASVATERRRNKNEVSLNLFLGQAAVTILTCLCAVMTLREKTGF